MIYMIIYITAGVFVFVLLLAVLYSLRYKLKEISIYKNLKKIRNVSILKNFQINHKKMRYVLVSEKGLFVVNVINEKGTFFGSDFDKTYTIARGDKKMHIVSPSISTKEYVNDLKALCQNLGYQNIPIYMGIIYTRANTSYVASSYKYKNGKEIVSTLRIKVNKAMNKGEVINLYNDLSSEQRKSHDIDVVYYDRSFESTTR